MAKQKTKTLAERQLDDYHVVFKALAHPSRRNILTVLEARGGAMTAGDIVSRFNFSWPTMTRHLRQLEKAGLIKSDKISREQYYSLDSKRLKAVVNHWLAWFK